MYDEEAGSSAPSSGFNPAAAVIGSMAGYAEALTFIISVLKGLMQIWTVHLEMILRPRFSSEYFNPVVIAASLIAMHIWAGLAVTLSIFRPVMPEVIRPHGGWIGMGLLYISYWVCVIYHAFRVKHLMQHMELEPDSEEDGPGLPLFGFLPKANNWMRVRVWYEPALVILVAITLFIAHIFDLFALLYLLFCACMLFGKAALLSYEGWRFERGALNKRNRAKRIRGIFTGKESPQTFAGHVLATVPDDPKTRAYAAAAMTGMREEYAHLVSDPVPPESKRHDDRTASNGSKTNGTGPIYATYAEESGVNGLG